MKINTLKLSYALLFVIITSCGSKKSISTEVTKPAIVSLDPSIKRIGIVNRSIVKEDNNALDKLDKILSVEGADLDKQGAHQAVLALKNELGKNAKFSEVKLIETNTEVNPGGGVFPAPYSWDMVQQICAANNVDAIFVLSLYDTDANASYDTSNTKVKGPLGIEIPAIRHSVIIVTNIKAGWRIYDPINKVIKDELAVNTKTTSTGSGINPVKAIEAAKNRKQSVFQISQQMAIDYSTRLLPYKGNIYRKYYTSGTSNFEAGRRYVETGQWEKAAELWEKEVKNEDPEIAGQASFNMAFYNEIKGDFTQAIEWANKSYAEYGNKQALKYKEDLEERISDRVRMSNN
ncbi:DUF6340 family protein [uncultured Algibacter sp.]|uniref:DUF6340 family protein n=1 Tax=uncultured Algibacter sp. TaxID=298659 RepID=UPI003217E07D